jgi:hypothetical protein
MIPPILGSILVVLCPLSPKYHFTEHGETTTVKEQQIHNSEIVRKVFKLVFWPLDALFNTEKLMLCVDYRMQQGLPVICPQMVDYFENIHLHSIMQANCRVFAEPNGHLEKEIHRWGN